MGESLLSPTVQVHRHRHPRRLGDDEGTLHSDSAEMKKRRLYEVGL
jgi:hypothetical protein